jgi:hypothetical protein
VFDGGDGGGGAVTVAVAAEDAGSDEPPPFVAVTTDRIVCPTSPAANVYEFALAPPIVEQTRPRLSQSCQA